MTLSNKAWSQRLALTLIGFTLVACQPAQEPAQPVAPELNLESDSSKASYSMGFDVTSRLKEQLGVEIDADAYTAGATDALAGAERQVAQEEAERTLKAMNEAAQAKREAALEQEFAEVKDAGMTFLADNATKEGVVTLPSGLQYLVLTQAPEGAAKPGPTEAITAHYHGTLTDGTVFDSSVERGEPATFPLNRVIAGWTEALQLMGVGAKWRLFLPPELAYGNRATGSIPPYSTLIFDVELLEIQGP